MPLNRATITVASRIMLPTYVAFFGVLGLNYLVTPTDRLTASPSLAYANSVMPLPSWGGAFLGVSILMAGALTSGRRTLYRFGLLFCALTMTVWTGVNIAAVFATQASPAGWDWPLLVVCACVATYRSLSILEV